MAQLDKATTTLPKRVISLENSITVDRPAAATRPIAQTTSIKNDPPTAFQPLVSKLDPNGWLPCWRSINMAPPHSAVVPIFLSGKMFPSDCLANARDGRRARQALLSFQALPSFLGTVYCMRDRRIPYFIKIGESQDAFARMRQSPWRRELGRIPHKYREVEFVLVCLSIGSRKVETSLHTFLKRFGFDLTKLLKRGREWFYADRSRINAAIENEFRSTGEQIWVRGLAQAHDNGYRHQNSPRPYEFGTDYLFVGNLSKRSLCG